LSWKGHQIRGQDTYLKPWKEITHFATEISTRLLKRFPKVAFLEALQIIDPQAWKVARDRNFTSGTYYFEYSISKFVDE